MSRSPPTYFGMTEHFAFSLAKRLTGRTVGGSTAIRQAVADTVRSAHRRYGHAPHPRLPRERSRDAGVHRPARPGLARRLPLALAPASPAADPGRIPGRRVVRSRREH